MPPKISRFAQSVPGSTVVAMSRQADELEAEGVKIIDFGIGEPDFTVPDVVAYVALLREVERSAARRPPAVEIVQQQHPRSRHYRAVEHVVDG